MSSRQWALRQLRGVSRRVRIDADDVAPERVCRSVRPVLEVVEAALLTESNSATSLGLAARRSVLHALLLKPDVRTPQLNACLASLQQRDELLKVDLEDIEVKIMREFKVDRDALRSEDVLRTSLVEVPDPGPPAAQLRFEEDKFLGLTAEVGASDWPVCDPSERCVFEGDDAYANWLYRLQRVCLLSSLVVGGGDAARSFSRILKSVAVRQRAWDIKATTAILRHTLEKTKRRNAELARRLAGLKMLPPEKIREIQEQGYAWACARALQPPRAEVPKLPAREAGSTKANLRPGRARQNEH